MTDTNTDTRLPYTPVHHSELARQRAQAQQDIEQIMDRYTWDGFISMLAEIAYIKSDREYHAAPHLNAKRAKAWHKVGTSFSKLKTLDPNTI